LQNHKGREMQWLGDGEQNSKYARDGAGMDLDIAADVRNAALPDDVATTAYYVASEAVTNTLSPSSCCLST
jgi:signal transduction histidine kinase